MLGSQMVREGMQEGMEVVGIRLCRPTIHRQLYGDPDRMPTQLVKHEVRGDEHVNAEFICLSRESCLEYQRPSLTAPVKRETVPIAAISMASRPSPQPGINTFFPFLSCRSGQRLSKASTQGE
jgi:hypothetical protein